MGKCTHPSWYTIIVEITMPCAKVVLTELDQFIRHRRDSWAYVSGIYPELSVKRKILQHEYGEIIKDQYSEHGHIDLIVHQGRAVDLTAEDLLNADPIPTTRATLNAWAWITREKSWIEGLVSMTVTEGPTTIVF